MAGVAAMGDLSHELESLIIGIELGNVPPSQEARSALQRSLDALGSMRDLLAQGQPIAQARALLAQVRALSGEAPEAEPVARASRRHPSLRQTQEPGIAEAANEPVAEAEAESLLAESAPAAAPQSGAEGPAAPPVLVDVPHRPPAFERLLAAAAVPPGREPTLPVERAEMARVDADLLEPAAEQRRRSQHRARAPRAADRLDRIQPRRAVAHGDAPEGTAAQARDRDRSADPASPRGTSPGRARDFDPLELDRYSSIQQFSRALAETASDVGQHPAPARDR